MALIECRECKANISDQAKVCPKCGVDGPTPPPNGTAPRSLVQGVVGLVLLIGIWNYIVGPADHAASDRANNPTTAKVYSEPLEPHSKHIVNAVRYQSLQTPIGKRWENVEGEFEGGSFRFTVWYLDDPYYTATAHGWGSDFAISMIRGDTEEIGRTTLKVLNDNHYSPTGQKIGIHIYAGRRVRGETGKPLAITYGVTNYNPFTDTFDFRKCDPTAILGC